ncbi:MAG: cation:proton antiporter [Candidatus Bathyarchaeia archaeon]
MAQDPAILLLYEVGLLIVLSSLASELFKRVGLPGLIGAILVGVFVGGPGGLGLVTNLAVVDILAVLGAVLILFVTGLEFEASAFQRTGRKAFLLTTTGVALSVLSGYLAGFALGWPDQAALLLGIVIAPSGTSIVAAMLSEEGKVETKAGSTLLTACVIDDVEGVLLLTVALGSLTRAAFSPVDLLWVGSLSVLFILAAVYIGGRLFPVLISRFGRALSDEVLFATLLGLGLMLSFAATLVGLAAITGAFIMGAMIPYRKVGEKLAHRLIMMKEVFATIFFTSIGLSIDPYSIPGVLPIALLILGFALAARLAGGIIGGMLGGFHGKTLLAMAVGLAVRAEMSLIIARESVAVGIVGVEFLAVAATVVIGSMIIALPLLSKLSRLV